MASSASALLRAPRILRLGVFAAFLTAVLLGLVVLQAPAFADGEESAGGAPEPRASDITASLQIDGMKLQKKSGDAWLDVPAGTVLTSGAYVRIYLDWSIPDMTDAEAGSTFAISVNGDDHFLASDFGPTDIVDPGTGTVIGSYVVNGNRDANGALVPGQDITIVTTLSAAGAQFPSLYNGFFSLEGYVSGTGDDIVFTVNGQALPSIGIDPPSTGPLPNTPLLKYGGQVAGQNQIVWSMGVNLDRAAAAYADYAAGGSTASAQQRNLLLTDELQGGQAITSRDVVVYFPVFATTDAGEAQTEQYLAYSITDLFAKVEGSAADGTTQDQFADNVRFAAQPTIGVWEGSAVYIGFGDVPTGDGSSMLNIGNILGGQGESELSYLLDSKGVTPKQKSIIMKYLGVSGPNKGDFTSFIVELRADASETGQYENAATLTYGDSSTESAAGGAHFTVISGGVAVRDGKALLTKVDAGDPTTVLPGAVFKLEKMQPDNSWQTVAGSERLTTGADGTIAVTGLLLGQYRFVELAAPEGYELEAMPVEFAIASSTPNHAVALVAENAKSPVLGNAKLLKHDADDRSRVLSGAVFRLEQQAADGTWVPVDAYEHLVTDSEGFVGAEGLPVGSYRFVEVEAPEGYVLDGTPISFDVTEEGPTTAELSMGNVPVPPDPVDPVDPVDPPDSEDSGTPARPDTPPDCAANGKPGALARTGDAAPMDAVTAIAAFALAVALGGAGVLAARRMRR